MTHPLDFAGFKAWLANLQPDAVVGYTSAVSPFVNFLETKLNRQDIELELNEDDEYALHIGGSIPLKLPRWARLLQEDFDSEPFGRSGEIKASVALQFVRELTAA